MELMVSAKFHDLFLEIAVFHDLFGKDIIHDFPGWFQIPGFSITMETKKPTIFQYMYA